MSKSIVDLKEDQVVTGDRVAKEYRDRYANFSKGAHFQLGGQDGAIYTQQKTAFSSPGLNPDKNKVLDENIRNMRASHFDVGKCPSRPRLLSLQASPRTPTCTRPPTRCSSRKAASVPSPWTRTCSGANTGSSGSAPRPSTQLTRSRFVNVAIKLLV